MTTCNVFTGQNPQLVGIIGAWQLGKLYKDSLRMVEAEKSNNHSFVNGNYGEQLPWVVCLHILQAHMLE